MDEAAADSVEMRVHESLKKCAVAKDTAEARNVLIEMFENVSLDDHYAMKCMLIEVCVCVFHGFSTHSLDKEMDVVVEPTAVELIPKRENGRVSDGVSDEVSDGVSDGVSEVVAGGEVYRESKLGREPLSTVGIDKVEEGFEYDQYSDDSHGDTSYSDSDFGAMKEEEADHGQEEHIEKGKAKWAAVLSDDIHRQHASGPGASLTSSGHPSTTGSPNNATVTCEDLFQALASTASTVVIPKLPSMSNVLKGSSSASSNGDGDGDYSDSDDSSSLAETVSESSSIPSHLPTSVTVHSMYSNHDDKDDGFALSSVCSEDIQNLNNYANAKKLYQNENKDDDDSDGDSSDFNSQSEDNYQDSPPVFQFQSPSGSRNINSLLSDNSEVEIDFNEGDGVDPNTSPIRVPDHHRYQEEQRKLFEQGNCSDSGLEEGDDDSKQREDLNDRYECDRYYDDDNNQCGRKLDNSTSSSVSGAANSYDANMRKLLEATIVDVIVEEGMERLSTPVKNKLSRHVSNSSQDKGNSSEDIDKVLFTNAVLKKMCRTVSIELSLELRSPSCNLSTDGVVDDGVGGLFTMSTMSSTSDGLKTEVSFSSTDSLSPSAREIEHMIWPVFSSFLNAEESDEMVGLLVDSLATLIFDNTLQPLYSGLPDIEGADSDDDDNSNQCDNVLDGEAVVDPTLTSLAEVRAAGPVLRVGRAFPHSSPPTTKSRGQNYTGEEAVMLKSGSQNSLVNQYIHEIRHHESEVHNRHQAAANHGDMSDDDTPPSSHHCAHSITATVDSHEVKELQEQDDECTASINSGSKTSEISEARDHTAPWNNPESPMDDLFRRTHNAIGSPFKLPIGINSSDHESDDPSYEDDNGHHEDEEFYDEDDYAQNLYGSGGYVAQSPDRNTPCDRSVTTNDGRSITTTDALAGQSVVSQGGMSSSTSSSSSSPDTVSSPLTHDNYNSSPYKHHQHQSSEELSNLDMDEESSTNSLSMQNLDGDNAYRRDGGASVSNTSLSSPSISTRRSDAITVSDLPDNFGSDFFGTDNNSLDRLSGSDDDNDANNYDYDEPTPSTDGTVPSLTVNTHYSAYERSMLEHLDKIANSPEAAAVTAATKLNRSTSLSSSQGADEGIFEDDIIDNLIVLPRGGISPLGENHMFGDAYGDDTSNDIVESESSMYEEDSCESSDDDNEDGSDSLQPSVRTDATVVCEEEQKDLRMRDYDLYGLNLKSPTDRKANRVVTRSSESPANGDDFGDQIPLPRVRYDVQSSIEHDHHPSSRHAHPAMTPSELHVSQQSKSISSPKSPHRQKEVGSPPRSSDAYLSDSSNNSSPQSIYSSRLGQSIPLTSFAKVLYSNSKTASQSFSEHSSDEKKSDQSSSSEGFMPPPTDYEEFTDEKDIFFESSSGRVVVESSAGNQSLNADEEAQEDIRLFNEIVSSMGMIDPTDQTAQTNALFMAELMKSTLDDNAMSFYKGSFPRDDRNDSDNIENNPFFDDGHFLNMESVSNRLDSILKDSTLQQGGGNTGQSSGTSFDRFGLQVSFDSALTPEEYDNSIADLSKSQSKNKGKAKSARKTVSEDILMKGQESFGNGCDDDYIGDGESEFERSSSSIRSDAMKQFGEMVQRYAAPMDLSPLKKRNSSKNKDFFPVDEGDSPRNDDVYDNMRNMTINADDNTRSPLDSNQAYNVNRPSTAKTTPKTSLKGTTPTTLQRKGQQNSASKMSDASPISPPKVTKTPKSPTTSSKKLVKKHSSSSPPDESLKKHNSNVKVTSGKKTTSSHPALTHIVVIPPVPTLIEDNTAAIYANNRDVYVGPTDHHKFGVDFGSASTKHVQPGGNPPPAFSPTSPRRAANAISGLSKSTSSLPSTSQRHNVRLSTQQPTKSSHGQAVSTNGGSANVDTKKQRPKSAPRQRTPGKAVTITSNTATAAMAAQRAAKDPASLLRKSTSSLTSGKRSQSRTRASKRYSNGGTSRSLDDSHVKYSSHDIEPTVKTPRVISRQQAKSLQNLSAPTFSSAVRTLDIAGVDIAAVQAMAAAPNMSQLSISGATHKKGKSKK